MTRKSFVLLQILVPLALCASVALLALPHKAEAAFPVVQATNTSVENTAVTSHDVSLPAGIQSGDVLVAFIAVNDDNNDITTNTPAGWAELFDVEYDSSFGEALNMALFYKTASGSEGSTVVITTTGTAGESAHQSYRISGASGSVEAATPAEGEVNDPPVSVDPPNLAPSWGAADTLWLALCGIHAGTLVTSVAAPTNYTNVLSNESVFSENCSVRWPRLFGQFFRFDEWSLCRG